MPKRTKAQPADQPPSAPEPNVVSDLKQVGYGAAVLYGVVGVLLLGSQPAAVQLLTEPGKLSGGAAEFYLNVFKQAAPLTLAVAVVGLLWVWALRLGLDFSGVGLMVAVSALVLVVSTSVGNWLGAGMHVESRRLVGDLPMGAGLLVNSLYSYYGAYHGVLFWSSVLVGGYLAVVWVWKGEPLLAAWQERKSAAGGDGPGKAKAA